MKAIGMIPARYGSKRFEGKPLADIAGKSMIQRVYERVCLSSLHTAVWVATDDERIRQAVLDFGGKVVMTNADHRNGTSRCAEAIQKTGMHCDVLVNIQGDEPLIHPEQIDLLLGLFEKEEVQIATLAKTEESREFLNDPHIVKVHVDEQGKAVNFFRTADPEDTKNTYRHIGLYAYRPETLQKIIHLPPSKQELNLSLEQLRWLDHGYPVHVKTCSYDSVSVDTPEDIEKVLNILGQSPNATGP